jgi:hypothetical protein
MVRMFIRHRVSHYGPWRQGYDAFEGQRPSFGVIGKAVYQDATDPDMVTVTHDFATLEAAQALASSAALKQAMVAAGVIGAPDIWFTNPA